MCIMKHTSSGSDGRSSQMDQFGPTAASRSCRFAQYFSPDSLHTLSISLQHKAFSCPRAQAPCFLHQTMSPLVYLDSDCRMLSVGVTRKCML